MDIGAIRQDYTKHGLSRDALADDPIQQFENWFLQAQSSQVTEVNAMQIATVSRSGQPTLRTVLLKSFDDQGFVFYTNYQSLKAQQMADNPYIAALFFWKELERQVEINGRVEKVSRAESQHYFSSRPRSSQLGAWVSAQSTVIASRQTLNDKLKALEDDFVDADIPLPDFWGGYRLIPETMEFWQGRPSRLHDRFQYSRPDHFSAWQIDRLSP